MAEEKKQLKEYRITLFPKPMTFKVLAETPWSALSIAEYNYGSGDTTKYGFHSYEVMELDDFGEEKKS